MAEMFSGPPKPPPLPATPKPDNPALDAQTKAQSTRQGAAATLLTTQRSSGASLFGS